MKNLKSGFYILISFTLFSFTAVDRTGNGAESKNSWSCFEQQNTYQLVINTRKQIAIPSNLCTIIERNRHDTKVVLKKLSDQIQIKIYPLSELKQLKATTIQEITYSQN